MLKFFIVLLLFIIACEIRTYKDEIIKTLNDIAELDESEEK